MEESERRKVTELLKEMRNQNDAESSQAGEGVRLNWMYKGASDLINKEDYLLGKAIDKSFEALNNSANSDTCLGRTGEQSNVPKRILEKSDCTDQVELAKKILEDPLYAIKQKELEARKQLLNNPVKLKQIKQMLLERSKMNESLRKQKRKLTPQQLDEEILHLLKNFTDKEKKKALDKVTQSDSDQESSGNLTNEKSKKKSKHIKKSKKTKKKRSQSSSSESSSSPASPSSGSDSDSEKNSSSKKSSSKHKKKTKAKMKKKKVKPKQKHTSDSSNSSDGEKKKSKGNKTDSRPKRVNKDSSTESNSTSSGSSSDSSDESDVDRKKKSRKSSNSHDGDRHNDLKKGKDRSRDRDRERERCRIRDRSGRDREKDRNQERRRETGKEKDKHMDREKIRNRSRSREGKTNSGKRVEKVADSKSDIRKTKRDDSSSDEEPRKNYGLMMPDGSKPVAEKRAQEIKKYEKPGETKTKYVPPHPSKPLSKREQEKKLKEMMKDAKVRKKEREKSLADHRKTQAEEEKIDDYDEDFMRRQISHLTSQETVTDRIKSNINNIQRSKTSMDSSFVRR